MTRAHFKSIHLIHRPVYVPSIMIDENAQSFRNGYFEARSVFQGRIEKTLKQRTGHKNALSQLYLEVEAEIAADIWRDVQEEFPGMTREEYEADLEESARLIKAKYYNSDRRLKALRLV